MSEDFKMLIVFVAAVVAVFTCIFASIAVYESDSDRCAKAGCSFQGGVPPSCVCPKECK